MRCLVIVLCCGLASCGGDAGPFDGPFTPLAVGSVHGVVRGSSSDEPISDVRVTASTGQTTTSDSSGRFSLHGFFLSSEDGPVELQFDKEGYESTSVLVTFSVDAFLVELEVELEEVEADPDPNGSGDAPAVKLRGFAEMLVPLIFRVEVLNEGAETLTDVVLRDSVDAALSPISEADVEVNRALFPAAVVKMDPGGSSFSIELGALPPTEGYVRVYSLTTREPADPGVYCNYVSLSFSGGRKVTDIACVV